MTEAGGANGGATAAPAGVEKVLDLGLGHPDNRLLPDAMMREAGMAALQGDPLPLQYGLEAGEATFRQALAAFLGRQTGSAPDPARLFVTSGASVGLSIACTIWAKPGDAVLVEDPSYHLALQMLRDRHLQVVAVPSTAEGFSLDALQRLLEERNGPGAGSSAHGQPPTADAATRPGRVSLLYLVPFFSNPAGTTLTTEGRRRLLELTAKHGVTVVSDEVYRLLQFDGEPPASLAGPAAPHVLALNSFSKILAPGLRLGWIEGAPEALARIEASGILVSGGGLNPFVSAAVEPMLRDEALDAHLSQLRSTYRERAAALCRALERYLPNARFRLPEGGYFVWLELPGVDTAALHEIALEHGVRYQPGTRFRADGGASNHARVGFSYYPPAQLEQAVERLGNAVAAASATITPTT